MKTRNCCRHSPLITGKGFPMQRLLVFVCATFAFVFSQNTFAATVFDAANGAFSAHKRVVTHFQDFSDADVNAETQAVIAGMVAVGIEELRAQGYKEDADSFQQQWNLFFATQLYSYSFFDNIGDHAPLSQWLSKFYAKLTKRIPPKILKHTRLE